MEKVEIEIVETEETIHHFYCDDCDAYIGTSEEYDDGWYEELGEFELHWYTPKGWYKLEKCLCHTCAEKYLSTVYAGLESAGFELNKY